MLKSILNLGSELTKTEQQSINGGLRRFCDAVTPCPVNYRCNGCHCVYMIEIDI